MLRSVVSTYRAAFSGLPRGVWFLSAVGFVNRSGSMVLPFLGLYLTRERGLSVAAAGRVLALYGMGSIAGSWLGGRLSDRLGAERTMALSLVTSGLVFLWLGMQREVWAIAAGAFALSLTADAFRPAVMAAIAAHAAPETQVRSFALLRLAVNLGMTVGPALGGVLALYGYFWLFVADAATSWAAVALIFALPSAALARPARAGGAAGRPASPWTDVPFLLLLGLVLLLAVVFFQVMGTWPLYLREARGFREDGIGALIGLNALLIVVFEMVLVHWAERRARMPLVALGCLLICAGFGLLPFAASAPAVVLTVLVWTLGEMLSLPLLNAVVAERAPAPSRGRYMGLYTMTFSLAFVVAPAGGTWAYDRYGGDTLWYAMGLLGLPLAAAALFGDSNRNRRRA